MQRTLSLEDTPSLAVPLPFMLTAPGFAWAAGLLLAWQGPQALASRWTPATLALTHLMTLGFLAMTMLGAVLQMLPVVAGLAVPAARRVARFCWLALAAGTVLLAGAFLSGYRPLFAIAAPVLALALLCFAVAVARALAGRAVAGARAMTTAMRLALASLSATAVLGLLLAGAFAGLWSMPILRMARLHAAWGLVGWVGVLVIGVSFQVIPMFLATPVYPRPFTLAVPPALVLLLAAWSGAGAFWPEAAIAMLLALFAGITLFRLARRKRGPDVTTFYWFASLGSLLCCLLAWALMDSGDAKRPLLMGILFIAGFAASAVNGMLYKIVPFLLWYHLGLAGVPRRAVPGMNAWISDRAAKAQFACHAAALAMLVVSVFAPAVARLAGALFAAASGWIGVLLLLPSLRYRRALRGSAAVGA